MLRGVAGLVATLVLAVAPAAAANERGRAGCSPGEAVGAAGVGDEYFPTYGNGGYKVRRYELDVRYDPATHLINRGAATIAARAMQRLCRFNLDFVGLEVRRVEVDGKRARWSRDDHELTIAPKRALKRKQRFEVFVRYAGDPATFRDTFDGATVAGQPESAAGWFPVNDHPRDKAAYRFDVTVPLGYEVVANGVLRDVENRRRRSTWRWVAREPMASYLTTIDIGLWDVHRHRTADGLRVYDAVDSSLTGGLRAAIDSSLARQDEMLALLGGRFGPYPFSTIGAIVEGQDDLTFALETQTRPVYSKLFWLDDEGNPQNGDSVVVHELAHQWFGDDVAVHRWKDIWLNEGFASYAEWLWSEHEGQRTPQQIFDATYDDIPADDPFWSVVIADPGPENLFASPIYTRGAMTLQVLRNEVGDGTFFEILREWARSQSGGTATTEDLIALAEGLAGRDLDADVWTPWLFTPGKPELSGASARPEASPSWNDEVRGRLDRFGRY
jgi:aminopeptidase N